MARKRNFKAEYQRRIANAAKRGLSRSQARGHARAGEAMLRPKARTSPDIPHDLQLALRALRQTGTISNAAKTARISREKFSRFLRENQLIRRAGRRWQVSDNLHWKMQITSDGKNYAVRLNRHDQASLNGRHQAAIGGFLTSNDIDLLAPFVGQSVIDTKGKAHPLETNPNALHRLAASDDQPFHQIYRLTL